MRIATLVIGLLLGLFFILFGFIDLIATGMGAEEAGAAARAEWDTAVGAYWILMFLWLIGAAFALGLPFISLVTFGIASIVGLSMAGPSAFIGLWGASSVVLAIMSLFGWIGKRRDAKAAKLQRAQDVEHQIRMESYGLQQTQALAEPQPQIASTTGAHEYCRNCGTPNPMQSKFCGECGARIGDHQEATELARPQIASSPDSRQTCPYCGMSNPMRSTRCGGCSTRLGDDNETVAIPANT